MRVPREGVQGTLLGCVERLIISDAVAGSEAGLDPREEAPISSWITRSTPAHSIQFGIELNLRTRYQTQLAIVCTLSAIHLSCIYCRKWPRTKSSRIRPCY